MCINLCKMPSQTFIKNSLGMSLNMVPSKYVQPYLHGHISVFQTQYISVIIIRVLILSGFNLSH